jgi:hypothetical protein
VCVAEKSKVNLANESQESGEARLKSANHESTAYIHMSRLHSDQVVHPQKSLILESLIL